MPSTGLNPVNASAMLPHGYTQADLRECLEDIKAHRPSTGHKAALQQHLRGYIGTNLNPVREIAPGCFSTGFACCVKVRDTHGIRPEGWRETDDDGMLLAIVDLNLAMMDAPDTVNPSDQITLENVMNGRPPPPGTPVFSPDQPKIGIDGLSNRVMVFDIAHPYIDVLSDRLDITHEEDKPLSDADDWGWARAAWAATFSQHSPEKLEQILAKHCEPALAAELAEMSRKMKKEGISSITHDTPAVDGDAASGGLVFKSSAIADCEVQMRDLTQRLLATLRDEKGYPVTLPDGPDTHSHVFALLRALELPGVIMGDEQTRENGTTARKFTTSFQGALELGRKLGPDCMDEQKQLMNGLCDGKPVLLKNGPRYALRMPIPGRESDSSESDSGTAAATGAATTGASTAGAATAGAGNASTHSPEADPIAPQTPPVATAGPLPNQSERVPSAATNAIRKAMENAAAQAEIAADAARLAAAVAADANAAAQKELQARTADSNGAASMAAAASAAATKADAAARAANESAASASSAATAPAS